MKKKSLKILSLDISSVSTGWCLFKGSTLKDYGKIVIGNYKDLHERMVVFKDTLEKILKKYKPDIVLVEDVWMGTNASTSKTLAKFCGIAEETSFRMTKEQPIIIVNKVVKGFFKCKDKESLYNFVVDLLDFEHIFSSYKEYNDVTDSIAQALYYINEHVQNIREDKDYGFLFIIGNKEVG